MRTGGTSPFAGIPTLKPDLQGKFSEISRPNMSISQTIVAILFNESDAEHATVVDELFVWDWQTGSLIHVSFFIHSTPFSSFESPALCLESDQYVL